MKKVNALANPYPNPPAVVPQDTGYFNCDWEQR